MLSDIQMPFHHVRKEMWNPGATMPLVLPFLINCNTSDEEVWENIRVNSLAKRADERLLFSEEHDGIAILCGMGPSIADDIGTIREMLAHSKEPGQRPVKVFACNSAAIYLASQGIIADYQVVVDSRPQTKCVIGPAAEHLFASQCSPVLFEAVPGAKIWHLEVVKVYDYLPEWEPEDALMAGGGATVGNTSICLLYGLGFRTIEIFGFDSSNKGSDSHVIHQPLNDGEPMKNVHWRGKVYISSLTMHLQAERFQTTARAFKRAGGTIHVHGYGLLPDVYNADPGGISEVEKYRMMWEIEGYRNMSPGEESAQEFVRRFGLTQYQTVIDFGCGTGKGGVAVRELTGAQVVLVDFAENCLDHAICDKVRADPCYTFVKCDLTQPMTFIMADFGAHCRGFCCDVMEHIPPADVDTVIGNIMSAVNECFFRIDFRDDLSGIMIGESLHLSVHDFDWWADTFRRLGHGVTRWSHDCDGYGLFHVSRHAGHSVPADEMP